MSNNHEEGSPTWYKFLALWTKAVDGNDYIKDEWKELRYEVFGVGSPPLKGLSQHDRRHVPSIHAHTVLCVLNDPSLLSGPCKYTAPTAGLFDGLWCVDSDMFNPQAVALVLAWKGCVVVPGCDAFGRAVGVAPSAIPGMIECILDGDSYPGSWEKAGRIIVLGDLQRESK